jgi:hypothetical protein
LVIHQPRSPGWIRLKFDPKKGSKFIYFAYMDEENIFLGEASYRFIRVPVNQKVFYDTYVKERATEELLI